MTNQSSGDSKDTGRPRGELGRLARLFLRLGSTAFGGPAAHIAMMEDEVVGRRGWLTRQEFLDLLGAANLIPGPNSTELAIHIGHKRAGWRGLLVAGTCFILPAMTIALMLAWAYVRFGSQPRAEAFLYGVKPAIIAVIAQALWRLGGTALKSWPMAAVAAGAVAASLLGANEVAVLAGAGAVAVAGRAVATRGRGVSAAMPWLLAPQAAATAATAATAFSLGGLFLVFLKVGAVLFGSGYLLLSFLRTDLVERLGWLTEAQLLDAVAIGQMVPGPIFTTATFVGYLLGGVSGAVVATLGIFLPAFIYVAVSGPLVPRLRKSPSAGAFLDGVNASALALMAVVTVQLGAAAIVDLPTVLIAAAAALLLFKWRVNSAWLVIGGGLLGVGLSLLR